MKNKIRNIIGQAFGLAGLLCFFIWIGLLVITAVEAGWVMFIAGLVLSGLGLLITPPVISVYDAEENEWLEEEDMSDEEWEAFLEEIKDCMNDRVS